MVFIGGVKYACERCIRGHRVTSCKHTDQPLIMIKPKGRPATQCDHCRDARKKKMVHIRCSCGAKDSAGHQSNCARAGEADKCTCARNKAKASKPVFLNLGGSSSLAPNTNNGSISKTPPSHVPWGKLSEHFPLALAEESNLPGQSSSSATQYYDLLTGQDNAQSYSSSSSSLSSVSSTTFASDGTSPPSTSSPFDLSLEAATSTFVPFSTSSGHPAVYAKHDRKGPVPGLSTSAYNPHGHNNGAPETILPLVNSGQSGYMHYPQQQQQQQVPLSYSGSESFNDLPLPSSFSGNSPYNMSSNGMSSRASLNFNQLDPWAYSFCNGLEI